VRSDGAEGWLKFGYVSLAELASWAESSAMTDSDAFKIPLQQERLREILRKVVTYQYSLPDGRAVELEELECQGILSTDDMAFLTTASVTYKPHRVSDFHALDMFHMPTDGGGCVFIGPSGPSLIKRGAPLGIFASVVDSFLRLPRPQDELLLHIEFTEHDGMAVAAEMICFNLRGADWKQRLPAIRNVAAEFGIHPFQDEEILGSWLLTFRITPDAAHTAAAVVALLSRGCGFTDNTEITYSAGALDATS
jgi:hypothetical protein